MAAVAARHSSATNSPHMGAKSMTASPRSSRNAAHHADALKKDTSSTAETKQDTTLPSIKQTESTTKDAAAPANAPLAPPPKPSQAGDSDYFSGAHNLTNLSKEPNPFENAFGNPSETPGKGQLPGVASLTSPASLLPNNTPGWPGSLRSGPLSPAMLAGPTGTNDYFNSEHHFGGSFPTPNESSLRSGLTPGGTGSMFPQPSPNSQAILQQLHAGGATPGTLDFHRTAMAARAQQAQSNPFGSTQAAATSMAPQNPNIQPDLDSKPYAGAHADSHDPFGSHQTNDAANGLFMLAQAGGQRNPQSTFNMPQQQAYSQSTQEKRAAKGGSVGSNISASTEPPEAHYSDDAKPQSRSARSKKASASKPAAASKRKNDETPAKASSKKQRAGASPSMEPEDDDDMDEEVGTDGKKMTDEEKRKNFLERNRVAALKCRQRKKQWLANLQHKVEVFTSENDALATTVTALREEIVGLKTLLLAHKDCPVSQAQGISGMAMQQIAGPESAYANPYGMAVGQAGMHRR